MCDQPDLADRPPGTSRSRPRLTTLAFVGSRAPAVIATAMAAVADDV